MKTILKLLKANHYIKNLVIFLPVIFVGKIKETALLLVNLKVFVAFCIISSAIYVFNDIKDIKDDQNHPLKCLRPIASGEIDLKTAKKFLIALLVLQIIITPFLSIGVNACIWSYFVLNIAYSLKLKTYKFVDMSCIAIGFVLRLLAGILVTNTPISILMMIMVFITSIFFTSSKRKLEYKLLENPDQRRFSMQNIEIKTLNKILYYSAALSILAYNVLTVVYTKYVSHLYITAFPFVLFITRILFLINDTNDHDDPMNFIEKDGQIKALFFIFFVLLMGLAFF